MNNSINIPYNNNIQNNNQNQNNNQTISTLFIQLSNNLLVENVFYKKYIFKHLF